MITVYAPKLVYRYDRSTRRKGNRFRKGNRNVTLLGYTCQIHLLALEANQCKKPTWRLVEVVHSREMSLSTGYPWFYLDHAKNLPEWKSLPWLDSAEANHPVSLREIKKLFPECASMPLPIALDYVAERC